MKYSIYILLTAFLCSTSLARKVSKIYRTSDAVIFQDVEQEITEQPVYQCGVGPKEVRRFTAHNRIVNGTTAAKNSWPSVVYLKIRISENQTGTCGGTILDNYHILTAAHCFNKTQLSDVEVFLGMHSVDPNDAEETRNISRMIIHQNYDEITDDNDIAILKLSEPLKFSDKISPACLPKSNEDEYENVFATVAGWGLTSENPEESPNELQQVTLKTMSNKDCNSKDKGYSPEQITKQMLCAENNQQDACIGDSGGPMFYKPLGESQWTQIGVVSFGKTCGDPHHPGVYARVTSFLNWIKTYTTESIIQKLILE